MDELEALFSAAGPLARAIPAYKLRGQQIEMASAVAEAIEARGALIVEAGTGTGKTFAYLVPALLSGGKVIISTGTKTLQDQLFDRDIPIGARCAAHVGHRGAAQGSRQLRLPLSPGAPAGRRALRQSRRQRASA